MPNFLFIKMFFNTKDRQRIMSHILNFFSTFSQKNINNMINSKTLTGTNDCGQNLVTDLSGIKIFLWSYARIATSTIFHLPFFAKIFHQISPATMIQLAKLNHLIQLYFRHYTLLFFGNLSNEIILFH